MEHENSNEQEVIKEKKRPVAITVICIIGFIGTALSIPLVFSGFGNEIGSWYSIYLGFCIIIGFASMLGLWYMKKWAAYTYTGLVLVNQTVFLSMGIWTISSLILPGIVVGIALANLKNMN